MKRTLAAALVGVFLWAGVGLAGNQETITIKAHIPQQQGMNVTVSKITPGAGPNGDDLWTHVSTMDFGTLSYDSDFNIFKSSVYFAVDVGVTANTGSWNITHTITPVVNSNNSSANLNKNINVIFVSQHGDSYSTQIAKYAYGSSNNVKISKNQVGEGNWLRIYYGIATGKNDAPGVDPITADKPAGHYEGTVTLTLTTN